MLCIQLLLVVVIFMDRIGDLRSHSQESVGLWSGEKFSMKMPTLVRKTAFVLRRTISYFCFSPSFLQFVVLTLSLPC